MVNKRCKLCQSVQKNGAKGYFSFPTIKRKPIREKWLKVCELPAETETRNVFICFRHFQLNNVEECSNYFRVMPDAVPSKEILITELPTITANFTTASQSIAA